MNRLSVAVVAAIMCGSAILAAAPASAATGGLEVSYDGEHYEQSGDRPLVAADDLLVPGSDRASEVWVRNGEQTAGALRIDVTDFTTDDESFASALSLSIRVGSDTRTIVLGSGPCTVAFSGLVLDPGESAHVFAGVDVDPALGERPGDSGRAGAGGSVSFGVRGVLTEAAGAITDPAAGEACPAAPDVSSPAPSEQPAAIRATGGDMSEVLMAAGIGAVLVSLLLLAARRRSKRQEQ